MAEYNTHGDGDIIDAALARLDLDSKVRLLAGQDTWTLPALPQIGLGSLVMSDGPIGVRDTQGTPGATSVALPSPTALAATWDTELARRAGRLLAQEARRKGVHLLLAPTVNLHRSPLGGRHFECYSEDPLLSGEIGAAYVTGLQEAGVGATVKHFVANDSETERFTVDVQVSERALRELYLAPFERIVHAGVWAVMASYNGVNGATMTEHSGLVNSVLKGEWGFDGILVSDWTAARDTVRAALGGLDVAMPGPDTVFGPALAQAVREGRVPESTVDDAVRRVLRLAARVGLLEGVPPAVDPMALPAPLDRDAVAHQVAVGSFVLLRNEGVLPLTADVGSVAVIGIAATRPSILGGGSARVVPTHAVSPLDGLVAAGLPVTYVPGADPYAMLAPAGEGFELRAVFRAGDDDGGDVLGELPLSDGDVHWYGSLPAGVDPARLTTVEVVGTFTPATSGQHVFGVLGNGFYRLTVDGRELVSGGEVADPLGYRVDRRAEIELEAHTTVPVSLTHTVPKITGVPAGTLVFTLGHAGPRPEADALIEEAVAVAAASDVAIVVVATTEEVESEGADRSSLGLPGRQDELVARVAAASRRTVVVVNAGSPVEMPWANDVAAILLTWFPGQEAGAALADVVTGAAEPGGRLPTTWPARLVDCPVWNVTPTDGVLRYDEDVLIGYRAWQRSDTAPAFWFGHGLSYTTWSYEYAEPAGDSVTVRVRNTGNRPGREVIQVYVAPAEANPERPTRWLAGFASVQCGPGESAEVSVPVSPQAMRIWDDGWRALPGPYRVEVGRSSADIRLTRELGQGIQ